MANELIHFNDYTIVVNQSIFHRENDYEWKYVGIWGDLLDDKMKDLLKQKFPDYSLSELFIAYGNFNTPVEIINENLTKRNNFYLQEKKSKNNF